MSRFLFHADIVRGALVALKNESAPTGAAVCEPSTRISILPAQASRSVSVVNPEIPGRHDGAVPCPVRGLCFVINPAGHDTWYLCPEPFVLSRLDPLFAAPALASGVLAGPAPGAGSARCQDRYHYQRPRQVRQDRQARHWLTPQDPGSNRSVTNRSYRSPLPSSSRLTLQNGR